MAAWPGAASMPGSAERTESGRNTGVRPRSPGPVGRGRSVRYRAGVPDIPSKRGPSGVVSRGPAADSGPPRARPRVRGSRRGRGTPGPARRRTPGSASLSDPAARIGPSDPGSEAALGGSDSGNFLRSDMFRKPSVTRPGGCTAAGCALVNPAGTVTVSHAAQCHGRPAAAHSVIEGYRSGRASTAC
eukprot:757458-Hanusia_phi.AAC.7